MLTPILPPGIDSSTFQTILAELSDIVGIDNLSSDATPGALEGPDQKTIYGDPFSLRPNNSRQPSGAVRPGSVEEIQTIVRLANRYKLPLWTVSRGKNLGYGGTAPVVSGSMVLDLHRMNSILEVNQEAAYAIVQPGVSFFDLFNYIHERKIDLWPSVPAIGWGSVVGNTLERGFGYTPNGEHSQNQCGMGVVLPNGELLRTGMGAMEGNITFPLFKGGYGPALDGLFYQSNLGIVTQIGIHLTPAPEHYMWCDISVQNEADLPFLVNTLTDLMRRNIIQNSPSISNLFRQCILDPSPTLQSLISPCFGKGCIPETTLAQGQEMMKFGFWKASFSLYGPKSVVHASWDVITETFSQYDGVQLRTKETHRLARKYVSAIDIGAEEIPHSGLPTLNPLKMLSYRGRGGGHICFSPVFPPSGHELYSWYLGAKKKTIDAQFDFFADFHVYGRYIIGIELVVYTPEEAARCDRLYESLLDDTTRQGFTEYRTHVDYMDSVAGHFTFNNGALRGCLQGLKDHFDPNGVLSPGKSGIWNSDGQPSVVVGVVKGDVGY